MGQKDFHKKDDQISGSEHKENLLRSALLFSSFLSVVMSRWIHPCMCMFLLVFGRLLMLIYQCVCLPQSGTTTVYLFLPVMQYHVVIFWVSLHPRRTARKAAVVASYRKIQSWLVENLILGMNIVTYFSSTAASLLWKVTDSVQDLSSCYNRRSCHQGATFFSKLFFPQGNELLGNVAFSFRICIRIVLLLRIVSCFWKIDIDASFCNKGGFILFEIAQNFAFWYFVQFWYN